MATMSAMPPNVEEIMRKACSDPDFITMIYLIIKLSETESQLPPHTTTVIGGAAFILHAYVSNGRNLLRMQEAIRTVPPTSDIDIAIWYDQIVDKDIFLGKNDMMMERIRDNLSKQKGRFTNLLLQKIQQLATPSIDTFEIEVRKLGMDKRYEHMTTTVHIDVMINGQRYKVVDIALKNAIYSQHVDNERSRLAIPVDRNVTYTSKKNTTILNVKASNNTRRTPAAYVRVPTIQRLIEQQRFALEREPAKAFKYQPRIDYLMQHAELGSPAALDAVRARFARAVQDTDMMRAIPIRNSGRPPLPPKRGGKRRTYRKNKRHTKRRQTTSR
jgi:hypothetical protein